MEKTPTIRERLDNFEDNKLKKQKEEFEKAVYGETAGITDFSDEAKMRLEEGLLYEEHLRKIADRSEYSPLDILDQAKAAAEYRPEKEETHQKQLAEKDEEQQHLDNQDDPRVERLMSYAQQVNKLKLSKKEYVDSLSLKYQEAQKHGLAVDFISYINSDSRYQSIQKDLLKKEDYLNDQLFELSEQDGQVFTDKIINEIIDATDHEAYLRKVADWNAARKVDNVEFIESKIEAFQKGETSQGELSRIIAAAYSSDGEGFAEVVGWGSLKDDFKPDAVRSATNQPIKPDAVRSATNHPTGDLTEQKRWVLAEAFEKVKKTGLYKKVAALMVPLILSGAIFSGGNAGYASEADFTKNEAADSKNYEILQNVEIQFDNESSEETKVADKITSYEEFLASQEYAQHKLGDDIEYSYEIGAIINGQRVGKFDMFPGLKGETASQKFEYLKKANFYSPELVASLAMHQLPGFELKYIDANGNEAIAKTPEQINQAVDQMKSNPDLFGKNYDAFLNIVSDAQIEMTSIAKGTFNVYKYTDRADLKEKLAIGQGNGGDALEVMLNNGYKIVYLDRCANVIVLKMHEKTTLVVNPDPEPETTHDPNPEPQPIPPQTPPTPPVPPVTPPVTPPSPSSPPSPNTPPSIIESKDPSRDININPNLAEQDKMGDQRVDSGGVRPSEDVTKDNYEAPNAPEYTLDKQKMDETKREIEKVVEDLNNSYDGLTEQEKSTIDDNQNGLGEVNRSYDEVAPGARPIETSPQPGNQLPAQPGPVEGEVGGF